MDFSGAGLVCAALMGAIGLMIGYTVWGYPRVLAWMARRWPKPVKRDTAYQPQVAVVISAYNGATLIGAKLESLLAQQYPAGRIEILVVDDGSTDNTSEVVRGFADRGVRLLRLERGGKPAALNRAVPETQGEIVVLTDIRQELEPDAIAQMMACFADEKIGVVMADLPFRDVGGELGKGVLAPYWDREREVRKNLGRVHSMFGATGPLYAIRRELMKLPMPADTLLDDMYLPLGAYFAGYRTIVEERAIAWERPMNLKTEFRRKVRTLAGNLQIIRQYPGLLGFGHRGLFHFLSYKVARLLLPYEFLALALLSLGLPPPWRWISLGGQACGYLLAAVDPWIPPGSLAKRLSRPARTLVGLVGAALFAVSVFWVPSQKLWKPTEVKG